MRQVAGGSPLKELAVPEDKYSEWGGRDAPVVYGLPVGKNATMELSFSVERDGEYSKKLKHLQYELLYV